MKTILVKKYQCEYCNEIFDKQWQCNYHEKTEHKCPECIYSYYVYGCELNCVRENENKNCRFSKRKKYENKK